MVTRVQSSRLIDLTQKRLCEGNHDARIENFESNIGFFGNIQRLAISVKMEEIHFARYPLASSSPEEGEGINVLTVLPKAEKFVFHRSSKYQRVAKWIALKQKNLMTTEYLKVTFSLIVFVAFSLSFSPNLYERVKKVSVFEARDKIEIQVLEKLGEREDICRR